MDKRYYVQYDVADEFGGYSRHLAGPYSRYEEAETAAGDIRTCVRISNVAVAYGTVESDLANEKR